MRWSLNFDAWRHGMLWSGSCRHYVAFLELPAKAGVQITNGCADQYNSAAQAGDGLEKIIQAFTEW